MQMIEDGFRKVGLRFLVIRPDETDIFQDGDWHLVKIGDWSNERFTNFKLFYYKRAKKNVWQLTANANGVLVSGRDYKLLAEHYPNETTWICQKIMEHMNGQEAEAKRSGVQPSGEPNEAHALVSDTGNVHRGAGGD
jgi:hypothetical protein